MKTLRTVAMLSTVLTCFAVATAGAQSQSPIRRLHLELSQRHPAAWPCHHRGQGRRQLCNSRRRQRLGDPAAPASSGIQLAAGRLRRGAGTFWPRWIGSKFCWPEGTTTGPRPGWSEGSGAMPWRSRGSSSRFRSSSASSRRPRHPDRGTAAARPRSPGRAGRESVRLLPPE